MEKEPDGWAVVMNNGEGYIVCAYKTKSLAESVRDNQPKGHKDVVVPIYFGEIENA